MPFATLNGVTLHFDLLGEPATRPVIVFSNSLGTDFRIWDAVIDALGDGYAYLLYDKRGHGLSDAPPAPYVMDDHIGDLAALMDHVGLGRGIVCGLSVGGLIAQGLYQKRPDLVRALVLCDTGHKIGTAEMWNDRIAAVERDGIASIADAILERWFSPAYRRPDNPAFAGYRNMLVRTPVAGYAGTGAAIRDTDYTAAAGRIGCPTLCMVGEHDGATPPALVQELAGLVPDARCDVIAGAGHLPCLEQPAVVASLLRDFITGLPA